MMISEGRRPTVRSLPTLALALSIGMGCAGRAPEAVGPPPIRPRTGPLQVDVVYPPEGSRIAARDSNFIFGSLGNGRARLTINGQPVRVEPNGAFLGWLPVPPSAGDTMATYELVASLGRETIRIEHSVLTLRPLDILSGDTAAIDTNRMTPRGVWWVREGEVVPVRVVATPGAWARLVTPGGDSFQLSEIPAIDGAGRPGGVPREQNGSEGSGVYVGELVVRNPLGRGARSRRPPATATRASLGSDVCGRVQYTAANDAAAESNSELGSFGRCAYLEVVSGGDTARAALPLELWVLEGPGPLVELREAPAVFGSDGVIPGRPAPGATYGWLWADGARAQVSGRRNDTVRIVLDGQSEAWVALGDIVWLPDAHRRSPARVGVVRLSRRPAWLEVRVSLAEPVPYHIRVQDHRVFLTLYGAYSDTGRIRYGPADDFFRQAAWEQLSRDRYVLRLELARKAWGYRARYEPGALVLQLRVPPPIDPENPLDGRRIVVDPGHPPAGAIGPTRLYEGDANLAIAARLKRLLELEGATVTLTRADRASVRLYDRPQRAELLRADVLVSIHNNALPDGVNPFENNGTSVYYFHTFDIDLARALQQGLLRTLGLRDLGISRANLALARPTWMPAALTEGAFMMIPEQEAALRTPEFQEAYARGVVEGLRVFLKKRAK